MFVSNKICSVIGSIGATIGKGLIAGLAGTAAITISQMIEMKITGRKPSTAPADAASKALDIKPATKQDKQQFSQVVHWTYGTSWGIARALVTETGLEGIPASLLHFITVWGTAMIIEPKLGVAPPVTVA